MAQAPQPFLKTGPALTIWAVSDGRAGIEAQVLGLAEAVARHRPAEVSVKHVRWRGGVGRLPWRLNLAPRLTLAPASAIAPPWPDIWIAAGRATLPLSTRLRRWSNGRCFVVQTQDPRTELTAFDLVIAPAHDRLEGDNVLPITGAPNRLTPDRLAADLVRFHDLVDPLPRPRIAVIVGGRSRAFDLPAGRARELGSEIANLVEGAGGSLMLSFTRRTPDDARAILIRALEHLPGAIWDGQGENPYFAFLAAADVVLVTEDSTNLATDAAAAGRPVLVLALPGGREKFSRFHADLQNRGVARPFTGRLETWTYQALQETDRAAVELLRRYDAHI
jgi:mitochondrial fission protein ELM1